MTFDLFSARTSATGRQPHDIRVSNSYPRPRTYTRRPFNLCHEGRYEVIPQVVVWFDYFYPDTQVCCDSLYTSTPVAQSAPRNLLTRWDVSSIPANGIFLTKNKKTKIKMPNGWRTINSLVHKIRLHGRRGKGMAESFSRQKSRHAPQKEGGLKILCDLPPV